MDIVYQFLGSSVKFNKPLILVHQNIRGLISKNETIVCLQWTKISPQVLCFSEHYMSENNWSLVSIDNYVLGSCFSDVDIRRVVFVYVFIMIYVSVMLTYQIIVWKKS
jgi:hypothetical protein